MEITIHRIYDDNSGRGYRVLVDRLWPRGMSREKAALDDWWKDLAPTPGLRKWFGHDERNWREFRAEYRGELSRNRDRAMELLEEVPEDRLVLLYGAKDEEHNHARVLKEYLESIM